MSLGMDRHTGRWLSDIEHLKQSIQVILTTRIGTRTERRTFGSVIPNIVDYPMQQKYIVLLYASIATALAKHEPRFKLEKMTAQITETKNPTLEIELDGVLIGNFNSQRINLVVQL